MVSSGPISKRIKGDTVAIKMGVVKGESGR